jgi:hypothetical protein
LIVTFELADLAAHVDRIFCERSPPATAVVTERDVVTWFVRFPASMFTLSVRSRQVPDTPAPCLATELPRCRPAGHRDDLLGEDGAFRHGVHRVGERRDLALRLDDELLVEVAVRDR